MRKLSNVIVIILLLSGLFVFAGCNKGSKLEIKEALKDEKWVKENIYTTTDIKTYESIFGKDWYKEMRPNMVFARLKDKNDSYSYIVAFQHDPFGLENYHLVYYKDEKVECIDLPAPDFGTIQFDINQQVYKSTNEYGSNYYKIENKEAIQIANKKVDTQQEMEDSDGTLTYGYIYNIDNKQVSSEEFKKFESKYNFVEIETIEFTDENIDKYVDK